MKGIAVLSVFAIVVAFSSLSEGKPAKRDASLNALVRSLEAFVAKKGKDEEKAQKPKDSQENKLTAEDVLYRVEVLEDRIWLEHVVSTQTAYADVCSHLMNWLHRHLRARGRAEKNKPDESAGTPKENIKRLLKRVLHRLMRADNGSDVSSTEAPVASSSVTEPASGGASVTEPASGGASVIEPEGGASTNVNGTIVEEAVSDESDEIIEEEEDEINWVALMGSCWFWTITMEGSAPDFPAWLRYMY